MTLNRQYTFNDDLDFDPYQPEELFVEIDDIEYMIITDRIVVRFDEIIGWSYEHACDFADRRFLNFNENDVYIKKLLLSHDGKILGNQSPTEISSYTCGWGD